MSSHLDFSLRLSTELKFLTTDPGVQSYFQYESSGQDEELKQFCIYGYLLPRTEPYKRGSYKVRIILPPQFPFISPMLDLLTYIYHPTVNDDVSKPAFCCRCCAFEFKPAFRIKGFIKYYVDVIDRPDLFYMNCTYNCKARELYDRNKVGYETKALEMVTDIRVHVQINQ
jgi:ubiquitin-protein ligase